MNHLAEFEDVLPEYRTRLDSLGEVEYSRSEGERDNHSGHLVIRTEIMDIEILVWESGECEFNSGTAEEPTFEHMNLGGAQEVRSLLERAIRRAGSHQL